MFKRILSLFWRRKNPTRGVTINVRNMSGCRVEVRHRAGIVDVQIRERSSSVRRV